MGGREVHDYGEYGFHRGGKVKREKQKGRKRGRGGGKEGGRKGGRKGRPMVSGRPLILFQLI